MGRFEGEKAGVGGVGRHGWWKGETIISCSFRNGWKLVFTRKKSVNVHFLNCTIHYGGDPLC